VGQTPEPLIRIFGAAGWFRGLNHPRSLSACDNTFGKEQPNGGDNPCTTLSVKKELVMVIPGKRRLES
jgi:hypothetical protein